MYLQELLAIYPVKNINDCTLIFKKEVIYQVQILLLGKSKHIMWDKKFYGLFSKNNNDLKLRFTTFNRENSLEFIKIDNKCYKHKNYIFNINTNIFLYIFKKIPNKLYISKEQ